MKPKPFRVISTRRSRKEGKKMIASMLGKRGASPFKGRLVYGGEAIRTLRLRRKMSLARFARLMAMSISDLIRWEHGIWLPDPATMALAYLLDHLPKGAEKWLLEAAFVVRPPENMVSLTLKVGEDIFQQIRTAARSKGESVSEFILIAATLRASERSFGSNNPKKG